MTRIVIMYFNYRREQSIVVDVFVWVSLAVTVISAVDYFLKLRRLIDEPEGVAG